MLIQSARKPPCKQTIGQRFATVWLVPMSVLVILLLYIHCLLFFSLFVMIKLCLVLALLCIQYLVSILVLQSSRWEIERERETVALL